MSDADSLDSLFQNTEKLVKNDLPAKTVENQITSLFSDAEQKLKEMDDSSNLRTRLSMSSSPDSEAVLAGSEALVLVALEGSFDKNLADDIERYIREIVQKSEEVGANRAAWKSNLNQAERNLKAARQIAGVEN